METNDEQTDNYLSNGDNISVYENLEKERFESKSPFRTLLSFSVGPVLFNSGISIHDAVDLILISKALGAKSLHVVGFSSLIRYLCMCVTIYFAQSTIAKISSLLGSGKKSEAAQVISDLYRLSVGFMIIVPLVFYHLCLPMLTYMGCTRETSLVARNYLLPILISMPLISCFQLSCGFLQSQGRSLLCGMLQIGAFLLNCGVISPTLLFVFRIPITMAGVSFAFSQSLFGLVLVIMIFRGKFGINPSVKMLCSGISPETWKSLVLGFPYILNILANALPPMVLLSHMMKAAFASGESFKVASVFSVFLKIQSAINSLSIGMNQGFMACSCYSKGSENYGRVYQLFKISLCLTLGYHLLWLPIMVFHSDLISRIWISDVSLIGFSKAFIRIPFYTNFLIPFNDTTTNFLLSFGKPGVAMVPSLVRGIVCLIYAIGLFYTDRSNPKRMMYTYCLNDVSVMITDIIILIRPFRALLEKIH